jgi:hypothetical protein
MERGLYSAVNEMKLHREKYSGDVIPYNLPELFQGSEKLEKITGRELTSYRTRVLQRDVVYLG